MSGLLDSVSDGFSKRMTARKRMAAHLGVHLTEDNPQLRPYVRDTVLACGKCLNSELCQKWLTMNQSGAPAFCQGADAFYRLASVVENQDRIAAE